MGNVCDLVVEGMEGGEYVWMIVGCVFSVVLKKMFLFLGVFFSCVMIVVLCIIVV